MRHQLVSFLNETPPRPASQVARELGVSGNVLVRHFPQQYRQLVEQYEQYHQNQLKRRNEQLQRALQSVLDSAETPPPSLREVARRLQMKTSTLTDACPQLCRSISHRYKAYHQARRSRAEIGLKQILATDETPPPSLPEAAIRLGEDKRYLYKRFPELCRQVTRRHYDYRPARKTKHHLKDHQQLHRQFAAIIAAEEEPPPSIREVARRLKCSATTLQQRHGDLCAQLQQQRVAYDQAQISGLPARFAKILIANESPAPSLREVSARLGVQAHLLRKVCPEMCTEVLHRTEAERMAARQQRKAVLDQVLADNNGPPPSLTQVARQLNCTDAGLAEQFPQESQLIMQHYQAYKAAEKQAWEEALQAALADDQTPPPTLIEVARQLGHTTSKKLQFHFPDICQQLLHKRQAYLANHRQKLRDQLAVILSDNQEQPPPPLAEVARRLGFTDCTLKRLFPAQAQAILERRQRYKEAKKMAAERALQTILANEQEVPPAMKTLAKELGYTDYTLRRHFPELMAAVIAKRQALIKAKSQLQF